MRLPENPRKLLFPFFLICAVVFSAQILPRWWGDSIVMDEEWELTASYFYWSQGDCVNKSGTSAPGALCGLPLLFMDLKNESPSSNDWRTRSLGLIFMDNPGKLEAITVWSRAVDWVIALLIGFLIFYALRDGPLPLTFSALVIWAFEPTLLAFSGTAKTDLSIALWILAAVLVFKKAQVKEKAMLFGLAGALAGLAAAARYNGIMALPVFLVMEILYMASPAFEVYALPRRALHWLACAGGFLLAVSLCFLPGTFCWAKSHPNPLGLFYGSLAVYLNDRASFAGQGVYFGGDFWPGGTYLNFPYHFFFKNTLAFDFLLAWAALLFLIRKVKIPSWIWVPPVVYLGLFWLFDKGLTIHHAVPVYPFLVLIGAYAFQWLWEKGAHHKVLRAFALWLLIWQAVSVMAVFPHHIAYANELLNKQEKYRFLYTFNWNLGQDMKRLAQMAKAKGWTRVKLLTEQRTDPYFYGLHWEPWTRNDLLAPQVGTVYVVDPSILYDVPFYGHLLLDEGTWINKNGIHDNIGGTLYYYVTPGEWPPTLQDTSPVIDSFIYYSRGDRPYVTNSPRQFWIAR